MLITSYAGAGGAGSVVIGGLGALFAAGGFTAHREAAARNSALHEFQNLNKNVKQFSNKINDILQRVDASKLRSALQKANKTSSMTIDPEDLKYYFGEILEMSKQNLKEVEHTISSLSNMETVSRKGEARRNTAILN